MWELWTKFVLCGNVRRGKKICPGLSAANGCKCGRHGSSLPAAWTQREVGRPACATMPVSCKGMRKCGRLASHELQRCTGCSSACSAVAGTRDQLLRTASSHGFFPWLDPFSAFIRRAQQCSKPSPQVESQPDASNKCCIMQSASYVSSAHDMPALSHQVCPRQYALSLPQHPTGLDTPMCGSCGPTKSCGLTMSCGLTTSCLQHPTRSEHANIVRRPRMPASSTRTTTGSCSTAATSTRCFPPAAAATT